MRFIISSLVPQINPERSHRGMGDSFTDELERFVYALLWLSHYWLPCLPYTFALVVGLDFGTCCAFLDMMKYFLHFWFFALVFLEFMEGNRHTPIFLFYTKAREGCRGTTMRWMPRALVAPMIASLDVGNPCPLHMPCVWVPRVWDQSEGRGCTKSEPKI